MKKYLSWGIFAILLLISIGYFPERLSLLFFVLAVLTCPHWKVREVVEENLAFFAYRETWICMFVMFLILYPPEEIAAFGTGWKKLFEMIWG